MEKIPFCRDHYFYIHIIKFTHELDVSGYLLSVLFTVEIPIILNSIIPVILLTMILRGDLVHLFNFFSVMQIQMFSPKTKEYQIYNNHYNYFLFWYNDITSPFNSKKNKHHDFPIHIITSIIRLMAHSHRD